MNNGYFGTSVVVVVNLVVVTFSIFSLSVVLACVTLEMEKKMFFSALGRFLGGCKNAIDTNFQLNILDEEKKK